MNRILLVDNYDSFTYNLFHLIQKEFNGVVEVRRDYEIDLDKIEEYEAIVISPGPGRPETTPIVMNILKILPMDRPVLGICLGMQCINEYFGGKTTKGLKPIHGKVSKFNHTTCKIFNNLPNGIDIARYHSLTIIPATELVITGYSDDGVIMSINHPTRKIFGLQFHPESFLTEYGDLMIRNFLEVANLL